jgi:hypothetical protein
MRHSRRGGPQGFRRFGTAPFTIYATACSCTDLGWGNRLGMDPVRLHAPNLIGLWEVSGKGLGSQGYRQRQGPKRRSDARVLSPVGILKCSSLGG